jgi:hypothetical protein
MRLPDSAHPPEFAVNVFSGWLRRGFLDMIARIAEGLA